MKFSIKKSVLICAFTFIALMPFLSASAAGDVYLPQGLNLSNDAAPTSVSSASTRVLPKFDAGTTQPIEIIFSESKTHPNTIFEYGVAREIKNQNTTFYEILSTEKKAGTSVKSPLSVVLPNATGEYSTSTYVTYMKTFVENDPESEHFYTSNNFSIVANETPFINIKNVNLIQSTGLQVGVLTGPTIYNPAKEKGVDIATSTSLEITFQSNQETIIHPIITFNKLRTGEFATTYDAGEILIKKGETYKMIPLPVFDYQAGVYVGKVDFKSELVKNEIDFQYIVAGDSATVGQARFTATKEGSLLTYDIFSTPIDLYRETDVKPEAKVYAVTLNYKKGNTIVYSEQKDVNFASTSFQSLVPKKHKTVDTVEITVVSKENGEVIYKGTKDLFIKPADTIVLAMVFTLIILALMIGVLAFFKRHKTVAVMAAVFLIAFVGFTKISAAWDPSPYTVAALSTLISKFNAEGVAEGPAMYLNEDITQKTYEIGTDLILRYKLTYINCANTGLALYAGFSNVSMTEAYYAMQGQNTAAEVAQAFGNWTGGGRHPIYRNVTAWADTNTGKINYDTTHTHSYIFHDIGADDVRGIGTRNITLGRGGDANTHDGSKAYSIPLKIRLGTPVITAATASTCGGKINLAWSTVPNANRYDVYRSTTVSGTYEKIASETALTYVDITGSYDTTYYYKLKAIDTTKTLESSFSNPVSAVSSAECSDVVTSVETLTCTATPGTARTNAQITWASQTSGITDSDYTFTWSGGVTGTGQSLTATYETEGNVSAQVAAVHKTEANKSFTANCSVNISNRPIVCRPSQKYCERRGRCIENNETCDDDECVPPQRYCATENRCILTSQTCGGGDKYCASLDQYIASDANCPTACGSVTGVRIPNGGSVTATTPGLCATGFRVLPDSLFATPADASGSAWKWVCTSNTGGTGRTSCDATCTDGTSFCPSTGVCSSSCNTCPADYAMTSTGDCTPPTGRIVYFRMNPDTASTSCPGFWNTEVSAGAHMDCKINNVDVPATMLSGGVGHDSAAGVLHTLSCGVRTNTNNTLVKTVSATARCFKLGSVIER